MMAAMSSLKRFFGKLKAGLGFGQTTLLTEQKLHELEEALLSADLGTDLVASIIAELQAQKLGHDVSTETLQQVVRNALIAALQPGSASLFEGLSDLPAPYVIMMCGINGSGKTTTIGKLANLLRAGGAQVGVAACDTFRAAAVEQLASWGEKVGVPVFTGKPGGDPASVAYAAYAKARELELDYLLLDTSGRMHNDNNLMEELGKMGRVLKKIDSNAPHKVVVIVDGNTGHNARKQIEAYQKHLPVSGLIVTKLDGRAKGGAVVKLIEIYRLPVYYVCHGEGIDDIAEFVPEDFAAALAAAI
jgi:fused signal recognition particle receptor